jgi:competence protein ComGF
MAFGFMEAIHASWILISMVKLHTQMSNRDALNTWQCFGHSLTLNISQSEVHNDQIRTICY